MSTQIKYAYLRHNTWIYRRSYPQALQPLLGSAFKQSLKTSDARVAKARVAELNRTFDQIVQEAQAHLPSSEPPTQLQVRRPRYRRPALLGDRSLSELIPAYLQDQATRLRPGSYKSVRFAMELLISHLGDHAIGALTQAQGREVLSLLSQLSPNIRKYAAAQGKDLAQLATLSQELEGTSLTPQTQGRIWEQISAFLAWAVAQGEVERHPWQELSVSAPPEPEPYRVLTDPQVEILLTTADRALQGALLFALLTGLRSGEICGLQGEDVTQKGNLGGFLKVRPNRYRLLKTKAAEREVPLHGVLERYLEAHLPSQGRLFPHLSVDRVVKLYAKARRRHPELRGTVFHSTRKWFITQCERTGVPEHFTATLVGHHAARSQNRLTYGIYSAGISDAQKRSIIDQITLPAGVAREGMI